MGTSTDSLFFVLEYDKNLAKLDLHGIRPGDAASAIFDFLLKQINLKNYKAQIIYGRGGSGALRNAAIDFLKKNISEKNSNIKLIKDWKESVLDAAGGRCLVLLED